MFYYYFFDDFKMLVLKIKNKLKKIILIYFQINTTFKKYYASQHQTRNK
jgi:hypothetical protein